MILRTLIFIEVYLNDSTIHFKLSNENIERLRAAFEPRWSSGKVSFYKEGISPNECHLGGHIEDWRIEDCCNQEYEDVRK